MLSLDSLMKSDASIMADFKHVLDSANKNADKGDLNQEMAKS